MAGINISLILNFFALGRFEWEVKDKFVHTIIILRTASSDWINTGTIASRSGFTHCVTRIHALGKRDTLCFWLAVCARTAIPFFLPIGFLCHQSTGFLIHVRRYTPNSLSLLCDYCLLLVVPRRVPLIARLMALVVVVGDISPLVSSLYVFD